jgi:diadenylate cyclase
LGELAELSAVDLLDLTQVARAMGLPNTPEAQDAAVSPRGYRLLARVPRIPPPLLDRIVEHFGSLQKLLAASVEELQVVEGIGEARARAVREGISRLAEVSIIDRFS